MANALSRNTGPEIVEGFVRNGRGEPKIVMPDGSIKTYSRASTFSNYLTDKSGIAKWEMAHAVLGVAKSDLLIDKLRPLEYEGNSKLIAEYIDEAHIIARLHEKADWGTSVHAYLDPSCDPLLVPYTPGMRADVDNARAFRDALGAEVLGTEVRVVNDEIGAAGTYDGLWHVPGIGHVTIDYKGLALDTPIPTPSGWTTMGEVRVGDLVFSEAGAPIRVAVKSKVKRIGTYVVTFDDGSTVTCDSEHIWWTQVVRRESFPTAKSVTDVIGTLRDSAGRAVHRVPNAAPLRLPHAELGVDPYVLGAWLGDGAVRNASITKQADLFEILAADGVAMGVEQVDKRSGVITRHLLGMTERLRALGVLHNKHIPAAYLRASIEQRTRLLQGLMDTDGSWNKPRRTAVFTTTDCDMAHQVRELVLSLGQRAYLSSSLHKGFGKTVLAYSIEFTPVGGLRPFRLPRKADQAAASTKSLLRAESRVIISIEPGPDVETACIGVESDSHVYLCGREMIPTHNTGKRDLLSWTVQQAIYRDGCHYDVRANLGEIPADQARTPITPTPRADVALIIWLPRGQAVAEVVPVNLHLGRVLIEHAQHIRRLRSTEHQESLVVKWSLGEVLDEVPAPVEVEVDPLDTFNTQRELEKFIVRARARWHQLPPQ